MCTWKFFSCCQVCFGQLHCSWLILKNKVVAYFCLVFSGIFKGKFLYFICCNKSVRRKDFFHIVFSIYWKICRKSNLSFFIRYSLLNQTVFLKEYLALCIFDIFTGIKTEDTTCKDTFCIFFFLQNRNLYFLTGILPFLIISDDWCVLITVGKVNISRLFVQHITMGCFYFLHIVFSSREISHLCNTIGICGNGSHFFIGFEIIFTDTICRFDIFRSKYIERHICKASGYILKKMLHGTFYMIQKCYLIQKLSIFVDDQKSCRYFIFHLYFLNLCGIFQSELHIRCFQISIRCHFLTKSVFLSNCQAFDHMWLIFYRRPLIHNISFFIKNGEFCPIQLHTCCYIRFRDFYCCRLVLFHSFQFYCLHILSLVRSIQIQNFIRGYKSRWCF